MSVIYFKYFNQNRFEFCLFYVANRLTILNVDDVVKEAIEAHQNGETLPPEQEVDESVTADGNAAAGKYTHFSTNIIIRLNFRSSNVSSRFCLSKATRVSQNPSM